MRITLIIFVLLMFTVISVLSLFYIWVVVSPVANNYVVRPYDNPFFSSYNIINENYDKEIGLEVRELFSIDRVVLFIMFIFALYNKSKIANTSILSKLDKWFIVFIFSLIISCTHSNNVMHSFRVVIDTFLLCFFALYIGEHCFSFDKDLNNCIKSIIILGILLIVIGLLELKYYAIGSEYRITGPFRYWENYGLTMMVVTYLIWYKLNLKDNSKIMVILLNSLLLLSLFCIFNTQTRTIMIALGIGLTIIYLKDRKHVNKKLFYTYLSIILMATIFLVANPSIFKATSFYQTRLSKKETTEGRIETYIAGTRMFYKNMIFGIGLRNFQDEFGKYIKSNELKYSVIGRTTMHNSYLVIASEVGLTGLIPMTMLIIISYQYCAKLSGLAQIRSDQIWGIMMIGMTISYYLSAMSFDPFFEYTIDNKLYYLCIGITIGKYNKYLENNITL